MRREIDDDPDTAKWKNIGKREALRRRAAVWAARRRCCETVAVLDADGVPAQSAQHAVQLLREHWAPVFTKKNTSPRSMEELLAHVAPAPGDVQWCLPFEEFAEAARRQGDSAPGPDGLPYSAWVCSDLPAWRSFTACTSSF